jgi:hypothetical protein
VVERRLDRNRHAQCARRADHEAQLELDVEPARRPEARRAAALGQVLAARAHDVRAADDDGPRAAVVSDREPAPVRQQRLAAGAEHAAEVRRVVERGVEVGVVGDGERKPRLDAGERVRVALGARVAGQRCELLAGRLPRGAAGGHERVERGRRERVGGARERVEQAVAREAGEVEHALGDAGAGARAGARRGEDAVG